MTSDTAHGPTFSDYQLGVDVGGTFTDLVFYGDDGTVHCVKVPSNRDQPARSTLDGIQELQQAAAVDDTDWRRMHHTHSSTVATNALIERDGPTLGMLVTAGFRDLLVLQRFALPHPMRYDSRRVTPLVPRSKVHEVTERIDADGQVLEPLRDTDVLTAAKVLHDEGVTSIVVCFLHSYRNPEHEQRVAELVRQNVPELHVELSSTVWSQAREYERASLATMNAFIQPTVERYARDLTSGLADLGIDTAPRIARSNGGMELLATLRERPTAAVMSGPAAGVSGAALAAAETGWHDADLLTLDVGGTSADIGVIRSGRPVLSSEEHVAEFPLLLPSVAVSAIGAGGGSVLWLQDGATLKVGPRSVGADPGPACYGRSDGGQAALSDAFLVAGLLAHDQQLAGRLPLQLQPAQQALERLGAGTPEDAADAAIRVAVAMMAAEAMNVLSRRGVDVEEFRMVAYGGAGPLVAAMLADEIHVRSVLVPHTPGALSAFGAARADLEGDLIQPVYRTVAGLTAADLRRSALTLQRQVDSWVHTQNSELGLSEIVVEMSAEMRYDGQGYDVNVPLERSWLDDGDLTAITEKFHQEHHATYGHASKEASVWLNELRAHVFGVLPKTEQRSRAGGESRAPATERLVRVAGREFTAAVYQRANLAAGTTLPGPVIVEQMDTTTFVPLGWTATVHPSHNLTLRKED